MRVVLRSGDDISEIISVLPFTKEEIALAGAEQPEVEHIYVFLSNDIIDPDAMGKWHLAGHGEDKLIAERRELYLLCYHSIRDSNKNGTEHIKKLFVPENRSGHIFLKKAVFFTESDLMHRQAHR